MQEPAFWIQKGDYPMSRQPWSFVDTRRGMEPRLHCAYAAHATFSLLFALLLAAACAPAASAPAQPPASSGKPPAASSPPEATASAAPARPELVTTPPVHVNVGLIPLASGGPFFIAQERGYFLEVGLTVEFTHVRNYYETLPAVATGQLQVAPCSSNVGCSNALQRGTDLRIVADATSAGQTEKSRGGSG